MNEERQLKRLKRLRRDESFLGLHFDFHAGEDCREIGKDVTPEMVEYIIEKVKPDYLQCDSKGHPGISSYPTTIGTPAPGFVRDQLRIWREVTASRGIALYVHYSGVWDASAVKKHYSWARIDEKNKRDKNNTSVFGPYVDELLIKQIKELSDSYGIDGVWIDGDCWAVSQDYSNKAIRLFREKTGITSLPRKPEDPFFFEFTEFCRQGFRDYLQHYVDELHAYKPELQICSNWAYSSFMPEPVAVDVDFLSGDYPMADCVNMARFEARCLALQGKCWDLMAWSFISRWNDELGCFSTKSAVQLKQEASIVLALGGGIQFYFTQKRDGSIRRWQLEHMGEVAGFCRSRQKHCHKGVPIPQIALLYPGKSYYRKNDRLFNPWSSSHGRKLQEPMLGILQSLLNSQNVVDITMEHHLSHRMGEYPLIILPEWEYLDGAFIAELLSYVEAGGNLLVIGPVAAAMFKEQLGVDFMGKPELKANWLHHDGMLCALKTVSQKVHLNNRIEQFGRLYYEDDISGDSSPAASITRYGKGNIAAVYVNLGERYRNSASVVSKSYLKALVRRLFPNPLVEVLGSQYVDVTAYHLDNKVMIALANTSGPHADENVYVFDEIQPVGPLEIKIRTDGKPKVVTAQPGDRPIDFIYEGNEIHLVLSSLEILDILVIEDVRSQ